MQKELLKQEEQAIFNLRSLYRGYGYLPFKMSKFEEYELYMRNKDFLVSDRIITFNDTTGRLLALKPDVTLSIIRGAREEPGVKQKVYYNENVYRVSSSTHQFKEIMQAGLECIGDIDFYDIFEVISLAAKSLQLISKEFVLEISDLSLIAYSLDGASKDGEFQNQAIGFISRKSSHELQSLLDAYGIQGLAAQRLLALTEVHGERTKVLDSLKALFPAEALLGMQTLSSLLDKLPESDQIRFDFSVINDMRYYNGFTFKGFLNGISDGVLAGGQYGGMMHRIGKHSEAIGFALYLDLLEQLPGNPAPYDVDILLMYDETTDISEIAECTGRLNQEGKTVSAQRAIPQGLRYETLLDLTGGNDNA